MCVGIIIISIFTVETLKLFYMSAGKVLLGVLAGVAIGATLGILLAPDKGSETRRKIIEKGDEYVDGLREKISDVVDELSRKVEKTKATVEKVVDEVAQQAEKIRSANPQT
jgi:gas vesicle protein